MASLSATGEGIIAIFTVILGIATWFLWRATRDLVRDAKETGTDQLAQSTALAAATQTAADAAKASADILAQSEAAYIIATRVAVTSRLREFVSTSPETHTDPWNPNYTLKFRVELGNYGRTPGFVRSIKMDFEPANYKADVSTLNFTRRGANQLGFFVGAGRYKKPINSYGKATLGREEIVALYAKSSHHQLFVRGVIEFNSVSGEIWTSGFAFRVSFVSTKPPMKSVHVGGSDIWRIEKKKT